MTRTRSLTVLGCALGLLLLSPQVFGSPSDLSSQLRMAKVRTLGAAGEHVNGAADPDVLHGRPIRGETVPAPATAGEQTAATDAPAFDNFVAPAPLGRSAAEPSIGINWNTGSVMFQAFTQTLKVVFDDSSTPASATWTNVSAPNGVTSMDPILFTDPVTGYTSVSQLISSYYVPGVGCSLAAVTTDDGDTWIPSTGCGVPGTYDHQSIGGGPYAAGTGAGGLTDHATYYCGQNGFFANCALSRDGGITYGASSPVFTDISPRLGTQCMALHGHVKVSPDGTAYLPTMLCTVDGEDRQGMGVSEDNGLTWHVTTVPDSVYNGFRSDPSIGIGAENTAYFAYEDLSGAIKVAVSQDHGDTWTDSVDITTPQGLTYGVFPTVVAGDDDRAAVAFLGTPDTAPSDNDYEDGQFSGQWHLYIAFTYDRGATWQTVDATPTDPVQRGCIWWGNAGGCPSAQRNLLDFMDVGIDASGRVIVGYADGCIDACVSGGPNSRSELGTIARQSAGAGLFAEFDPPAAAGS